MPNSSDSDDKIPGRKRKSTAPSIKIENGAVSLNWKMVLIVIALLGGGGSVLGINLLPENMRVSTETKADELPVEHVKTHSEIDRHLEEHDAALEEQGKVIVEVKTKVDELQTVQHKQFARDEARRATEGIRNQNQRMEEYDRLVDINMKRLDRGADPCSTVNCEN